MVNSLKPNLPLERLRRLRAEQARLAEQFRREDNKEQAREMQAEADLLKTCIEATEEAIRSATAATLRTVALWGPVPGDDFRTVAESVEHYDHAADDLSTYCCPVCEEVECDRHCPLAVIRT